MTQDIIKTLQNFFKNVLLHIYGGAEKDLSTHGAVDDKVERVAENDDHVDKQRSHLVVSRVDDVDLKRVMNHQQD